MSEFEQRWAIARICGWERSGESLGCYIRKEDNFIAPSLPDYFNDLNAMHEAECWLRKHPVFYIEWSAYVENLKTIVTQDRITSSLVAYSATAKERAEAFLKTMEWILNKI